ncbi:MAG TPA: GAF domain-containing protein, partial [Casimicrobiaceae bacterium]|nr:GAF domain-containing protein [Casimicrobiaceae bacterium]
MASGTGTPVGARSRRAPKAEELAALLALIGRIQQGMLAKLGFQAIVDLVGDTLREMFGSEDLSIRWWDPDADTVVQLYSVEHGVHLPKGPPAKVRATNKPLMKLLYEGVGAYLGTHAEQVAAGTGTAVPGTDWCLSIIGAPIRGAQRVLGIIVIEDHEREHAFGDADLQALTTIGATLGTALENARLFDETQRLLKETEERNAELAVINSIQQAVAAELGFQAIVDVVGDKLREVFATGDMSIRWWDEATDLVHMLYGYEHGVRLHLPPRVLEPGTIRHRFYHDEREPIVLGSLDEQRARGIEAQPGTDQARSLLVVPVLAGERMLGSVHLENHERDGAYGPAEVRLLQTIASSMAVALLNARSYEAERQRNAELAVINSIQQGISGSLDFQGIVDLVGDKLREVLRVKDIGIQWFDVANDRLLILYAYEHGKRLDLAPMKLPESSKRFIRTREPELYRTAAEQIAAGLGAVQGTDQSLSNVVVPIIGSDRVLGLLAMENYEREGAYGEAELRLLQTVAASLGVALESARLFDETQRLLKETGQRNAELAVINSIQQGLASKIELTGIIDLVGDKLRNLFSADLTGIALFDRDRDLMSFPFLYVLGERLRLPSRAQGSRRGIAGLVIRSRQPLVVQSAAEIRTLREQWDDPDVAGVPHDARSLVYMPLLQADHCFGAVVIGKKEEHAFTAADVNLIGTVAASLSVALQNAQSFEAERQRAAELALINTVQRALAGELSLQGVYDAVGSKLREVFPAMGVSIRRYDAKTGLLHFPFWQTGDEPQRDLPPLKPAGFGGEVLRTRKTLLVNANMEDESRRLGGHSLDKSGRMAKSQLVVPLLMGGEVTGMIDLHDDQKEHSFTDADVRLLETIAATMSVALENARLFDETQRLLKETEARNTELAVVSNIQDGMARALNFQAIIDLVGDTLRNLFGSSMGIFWLDAPAGLVHFPYAYEHGERLQITPLPLATIATGRRWYNEILARKTVIWHNRDEYRALELFLVEGTDMSRAGVFAPIVAGDRLLGMLDLENHDTDNAYGDADVRLLSTVAASMGVALENARLFDETQRLLKETERRSSELAVINSIQQGMAKDLNFQAIVDLVGDKLREMFATGDLAIHWRDERTDVVHHLYVYEHGQRLSPRTSAYKPDARINQALQTGRPVVLGDRAAMDAIGIKTVAGTDDSLSCIFVPVMVGERLIAAISIESFEREHAFDDAQVHLLSTIAASMGVALENARLLAETQRNARES